MATYIASSEAFTVDITDLDSIDYAVLRLCVDRPTGSDYDIAVQFNGVDLDIPIEDVAERYEDDESYASLKTVKLDSSLLRKQNKIVVSWKDNKPGGIGSVIIRAAYVSDVQRVTLVK